MLIKKCKFKYALHKRCISYILLRLCNYPDSKMLAVCQQSGLRSNALTCNAITVTVSFLSVTITVTSLHFYSNDNEFSCYFYCCTLVPYYLNIYSIDCALFLIEYKYFDIGRWKTITLFVLLAFPSIFCI